MGTAPLPPNKPCRADRCRRRRRCRTAAIAAAAVAMNRPSKWPGPRRPGYQHYSCSAPSSLEAETLTSGPPHLACRRPLTLACLITTHPHSLLCTHSRPPPRLGRSTQARPCPSAAINAGSALPIRSDQCRLGLAHPQQQALRQRGASGRAGENMNTHRALRRGHSGKEGSSPSRQYVRHQRNWHRIGTPYRRTLFSYRSR